MADFGIYLSLFVVSFLRESSLINCRTEEEQAGKEKKKDVKENCV
jgi:hypothetical protein